MRAFSLVGLTGPRDLWRRLVCLARGHRYPILMAPGCALHFCQRGCGREFLAGYLTPAQYEVEMRALDPMPDEIREQFERLDWLEQDLDS